MSSIDIPKREDLVLDHGFDEAGQNDELSVEVTQVRAPKREERAKHPPFWHSRAGIPILALFSLSALAAWFLFNTFILTPVEEHGSQARLYAQFREQLALSTAPLGGSIKPGAPVALLDLGIRGLRALVVVEGTTAEQLRLGPGHLRNTPLPGQIGTSVVLGRSVTYGAPFRDVSLLRSGDTITATTQQGVFTYVVDRFGRSGDAAAPSMPGDGSRLTLVTSAGKGWRGGWAPDHAIFVEASLSSARILDATTGGAIVQQKGQPAPPGRPASVAGDALPMRTDTGIWLLLGLGLGSLLLVTGGLLWAWRNWGPMQTWIVGVPVMLAMLWGLSGAAARLLPNLI